MDTTGKKERRAPRKTWLKGVQVAMETRNLEPDQWKNRGMGFPSPKKAASVMKQDM